MVGRGNQHGALDAAESHQSAPLASLRDPDQFAPPPKHRDYYPDGGAGTVRSAPPPPPSSASRPAPPPPAPRDNTGMGGAIPTHILQKQEEKRRQAEEEESKPKAPQVPYRNNTTGFDPSNMPLPPRHRDVGERATPSPGSRATPPLPGSRATPPVPARGGAEASSGGTPRLPPRLPPRQNSHPDLYTPEPPPSYGEAIQPEPASQPQGYINQDAASRLGNAGVQVPGLNIGQSRTGPPVPSRSGTTSPTAAGSNPQLGELQARFARMNTGSSSGSASNTAGSPVASAVAGLGKKKPPPPPPAKKPSGFGSPGLGSPATPASPSSQNGAGAPPPIPMASKPRPS
jgi:hypothetical protein